jgi:NADH-quinone oxidoreductase subunit J
VTEHVLFWVFAVATVASTLLVVWARSPITSAMGLVATFFFLAGIYVLLLAHTIAVLQVLVYAGAIMVLFLFVIMLLSLTETGLGRGGITGSRLLGGLSAIGMLAVIAIGLSRFKAHSVPLSAEKHQTFGTIGEIGTIVYTQYLLPFEAVSLLLLVAIVGAVVVAKSKI